MKDKKQISQTSQDTLDLIEEIILLDSTQKQQVLDALEKLKKDPATDLTQDISKA